MNSHVPAEHYLSSGDYLAVVRDFALSKGIALQTLLKNSELTPEEFIAPPKLVNNFIVSRIGINLYNELSNPMSDAAEFGLCMTASSHGSLGIAVQCAATLKEAYDIMTAFYNTRINSQDIRTEHTADYTKAFLENKYEMTMDPSLQRFFDLATLISIATNTYKAMDHSVIKGAILLHVDCDEPPDFPFQKLLGVNVLFNQKELAILTPKAWFEAPLSISNPAISRAAIERCTDELRLLSPSDLVSKIRMRLSEQDEALLSLEQMSSLFCMSPATLKRKLKEKGLSYQTLKDEVRLEKAIQLIRSNQLNFEDIAARLGFSDASNFTKAFKGWTGQTPKAFRDQLV